MKKRNYQKRKNEFRDIQREISSIQNKINTQKKNNLRVAKAEEGLIAYILKNPEFSEKIEKALPAEMYKTDFNREVYKAIIEKLKNSKEINVSELSTQFTSEEISVIIGFKVKYELESLSKESAREFIKIIREENNKLTKKQIDQMSDEEINLWIKQKKK